MSIRLLKAFHLSFIVLLVLFVFVTGCTRRVVYVETGVDKPVKKSKPVKHYEEKSRTGVGKPYSIDGVEYVPASKPINYVEDGIASWYGKKFHGRKTACGEIYNMYAMTAAHKTLPLQTWVRVHNLRNNREITVRINDRGPFVKGRIIDLSYTGAKKLGMAEEGTAPVKITVLGRLKNPESKKKEYIPVNPYTGNFSIQVGAFQVKSNAVRLKQELSGKYDNVHIATYEDYRGIFYRVRVGQYSNLKDALLLEKQMNVNGQKTVFLIAE